MPKDADVTVWLQRLCTQDYSLAAQKLWEHFCRRLIALAHKKLADSPRQVSDAEDAALVAFHAFLSNRDGFTDLNNRDDLWKLLAMLTSRKAISQRRKQTAEKRNGDGVLGEEFVDGVAGREPSPEFAAMWADELRHQLARLDALDASLRPVVDYKMHGFTNEEIAAKLDWAVVTVERKLKRIREIWGEE